MRHLYFIMFTLYFVYYDQDLKFIFYFSQWKAWITTGSEINSVYCDEQNSLLVHSRNIYSYIEVGNTEGLIKDWECKKMCKQLCKHVGAV